MKGAGGQGQVVAGSYPRGGGKYKRRSIALSKHMRVLSCLSECLPSALSPLVVKQSLSWLLSQINSSCQQGSDLSL